MNLSTVKWAQWDKTQSRDLLVCSYVCALHCARLLHTILHRTDLIIFPLTLQTITTTPMMSIWGKGGTEKHTAFKWKNAIFISLPGKLISQGSAKAVVRWDEKIMQSFDFRLSAKNDRKLDNACQGYFFETQYTIWLINRYPQNENPDHVCPPVHLLVTDSWLTHPVSSKLQLIPRTEVGPRIQARSLIHVYWFVRYKLGPAYRPGLVMGTVSTCGYIPMFLCIVKINKTPLLVHTGWWFLNKITQRWHVVIEAGPWIDAGPRIQAGGLIHMYW